MQNIKKYFMTLALLLTAVTGAWADDVTTVFELSGSTASTGTLTLGTTGVEASTVKIHANADEIAGIKMSSSYNLADGKYFTIKPATGSFKAGDKLSIAVCFNNSDDTKNAKAAIYADDGTTLLYTTAQGINGRKNETDAPAVEEYVLTQDADLLYIGRDGNTPTFVTMLKVVRSAAPAGTALTPDDTRKVWTLDKMPAGNVELQVEYYPGMLVKPTNLVGGTLSIEGLTDTAMPKGFEKDAEGNIYVAKDTKFTVKATPAEGYHLVGWSDDATNKELEREFTMTDDDFTVTAQFSNEYTIAFNAANANTIESGKATVKVGDTDKTATLIQDGKLSVKYGQTVTLNAKNGYKFRKAEAKKGGGEPVLLTTITAADNSSFKSGSQTFGDVATVTLTGDYLINDGSHGGWYCQGSNKTATISVAEANGANITSVKFYAAGGGSAEDKDAPFEVTTTSVTSSNITTYLNGNSIGSYGVSKIEVYGTK